MTKLNSITFQRYKIRVTSRERSRNYLKQIFRPLNLVVSCCRCKMKAIRGIGKKPTSQITFICFLLQAQPSKDLNNNQIEESMSLNIDTNLLTISAINNKPNFSHNIVKMHSTYSAHGTGKQPYLKLTLTTYIWRTILSK